MDDDRKKALGAALGQIEKQFGKGAVMRMGDARAVRGDVRAISSGSLALDVALGIGGLPRGRVVEIYGPESSGKTTLTLHIIAEAQKAGGAAAFVDAEHALDPDYAEAVGVDINDLLVSQPDTGEQALEIADMLVRSGGLDVVVVDSVAALTPKAEIEGEMGDSHVGLQARLMSQALRKLTGSIQRSNTLVVFINQIRMKIGVMFGSPETTTGGNALKFYSSVRMDIRRLGAIKKGDEVLGNETRVKVVKNKMAPPFKQAEFEILYGEGISREGEIIDMGVAQGLIEKSGAWYSYNSTRIGQGKDNARQYLRSNPDIAAELERKIRDKVLGSLDSESGEDGEAVEAGATEKGATTAPSQGGKKGKSGEAQAAGGKGKAGGEAVADDSADS
ncbi:RecA protein [Halorhodospira halochloris]|uniref:Protein RecA n=1 Tax=Halorhodospira halochloris TaxID=1052 RepID=A0A110B5E0_HALHR|nr:recombinase RecA [Halorhodospira halochloris]BAU58152.1 RecA protein [Halorhodospira halochloris]